MEILENLKIFTEYVKQLKGYEKGEAQLFCDRLFRAFGHGGIIEANGQLESRIKFSSGRTKFADCLWSPPGKAGVLIEMKKSTEKNLHAHFPQARDYWIEMNPETVIGPGSQKPEYIILCNFKTFLIYRQLSFVDEVNIDSIVDRYSAFNFMLSDPKEPIFHNNVEAISQDAAKTIGELFKHLIFEKKENPEATQRFILQCVLSLFSEDFGLLPNYLFTEIINDCINGQSTYDLFGSLFRQMASEKPARAGRFKDVKYFNGGLFDIVEPLELDKHALVLIQDAASHNWKSVNPAIFGALFESTMNADERHAYGAHFTSEADILKIVNPTIIQPWKKRLNKAKKLDELNQLLVDIGNFKVLDPACGCGNFLYVAYMALKEIEMTIIEKIEANFSSRSLKRLDLGISKVTTKQFNGIDILPIAVEVAKMTMMLAKELAADEWNKRISTLIGKLALSFDAGLPLDHLDDCIIQGDALLDPWPEFDVVIGNPPYQSKNKMVREMDPDYIRDIRSRYPQIPGRSDYCVYWFHRAHNELKPGQGAGLVGTNTIRQNYSREGGLDYIVNNSGTIVNAVSSQVWTGDAVVYVSIVNWKKGDSEGKKRLSIQKGDSVDSPFEYYELDYINSSLSIEIDVTKANNLLCNLDSGACYQGQTHGHKGFLVHLDEKELVSNHESIFPFLIGEDLLGRIGGTPSRCVIDLNHVDDILLIDKDDRILLNIIKEKVYPDIKRKADAEKSKAGKTVGPRQSHLKKWWKFWRHRNEMINAINKHHRYVACSRVTKRPIFEFISSKIHPNDAIQVFPLHDDYSFGILQSSIHWEWFKAKCSTLKGDWRYTPNSVFNSFPWPQNPTIKDIKSVANAAVHLRKERNLVMSKQKWSLRQLYKEIEEYPSNSITNALNTLDSAVKKAYGMKNRDSILWFLLHLNSNIHESETKSLKVEGPGLPSFVKDPADFITYDCIIFNHD